jgi:hypothetical protein
MIKMKRKPKGNTIKEKDETRNEKPQEEERKLEGNGGNDMV